MRGQRLWFAVALVTVALLLLSASIVAGATALANQSRTPSDALESPVPTGSESAGPSPTTEGERTDGTSEGSGSQESAPELTASASPAEGHATLTFPDFSSPSGAPDVLGVGWSDSSRYFALNLWLQEADSDYQRTGVVDTTTGVFTEADTRGLAIAGWEPHSERMLAWESVNNGTRGLVFLDTQMQVVQRLAFEEPRQPSSIFGWSPDGRHIYLNTSAGLRDGNDDLSRLNVTTGELAILDDARAAAVSPQDDRIAYWTDRDADGIANSLSVINGDGTARLELVSEPVARPQHYQAPAWSPDGTLLAYAMKSADGNVEIFMWNSVSGVTTNHATASKHHGYAPRILWSPDGAHLLVAQWDELLVLSPRGIVETSTKLPEGSEYRGEVQWSADSRTVVISGGLTAEPLRWDVATNRLKILEPPEYSSHWSSVFISPDEEQIAWVARFSGSYKEGLVVASYAP